MFTTPMIRALKEAMPQVEVAYWSCRQQEKILSANPNLFKVFALSRGDLKGKPQIKRMRLLFGLLREIKKERFDVAFDFAFDHRYTLLLRLAGIKRIIGLGYKKRGRFLTQKIDIQGFEDKHVAEYYLDTLKFLDISPRAFARMEIFSSLDDDLWVSEYLKKNMVSNGRPLIAVCPAGGESWGKDSCYKRWPEERFAGLCDKLIDNAGTSIVLFGSGQEKDIVDRVEAAMKNKVLNTAGKLSLEQSVALMKKCSLAVCNDSGPLHIAEGLGVKTVCLSGPVDERVYGPFPINKENIVIKKELACRPCYKNFRFPGCNNNHACLRDIGVDEVFSAAEKLIKSQN